MTEENQAPEGQEQQDSEKIEQAQESNSTAQGSGKQEVAPTEDDAPNEQMQTPLGTPAQAGNQGS